MKRSDISDAQVVAACVKARSLKVFTALDVLVAETGFHWKVCYRAMERADRRRFIDYGVSLRTAWAEPKGLALLTLKTGG